MSITESRAAPTFRRAPFKPDSAPAAAEVIVSETLPETPEAVLAVPAATGLRALASSHAVLAGSSRRPVVAAREMRRGFLVFAMITPDMHSDYAKRGIFGHLLDQWAG
ncbi:hypothetical protein ACPPVT_06515 [Angustibacter sp. McL0619]|uniref:hypothetical protein n=1 Tax=Angustibacter sp. McL0619 TaxID=3415676 RepID=UPI003CEDA385